MAAHSFFHLPNIYWVPTLFQALVVFMIQRGIRLFSFLRNLHSSRGE